MVFTLGKSKQGASQGTTQGSSGGSIGTDTFRRWREVASKAFSGGDHTGPTELGELTHDPEVLLVDDLRPSWPDPRACPEPRATISLTREVSGGMAPAVEAKVTPRAENIAASSGAVWQALGGLTDAPEVASQSLAGQPVVEQASEESYMTQAVAVGGSRAAVGGGAWSIGGTGYANASGPASTPVGPSGAGGISSSAAAASRAQLRAVSWSDDMEKLGPVRIGPKSAVSETPNAPGAGARVAAAPMGTAPMAAAPVRPIAPPPEPTLFWEDELRRRFGSNLKSALGKGTIIEGTFSFDSPVCIDGTLIGEVHSTSTLIVGPNATVHANVEVGSLIVLGSVVGPVAAADLVEIKNGGRLEGDMVTKRVAIEDGGFFLGYCAQRRIKTGAVAKNEEAEIELDIEIEEKEE